MIDRPDGGELGILVQLDIVQQPDRDFEEFSLLAHAAGVEVVDSLRCARRTPDPRYFIGSGKAEDLRQLVEASKAEVVLLNHMISPSQGRNLEALLCCRVLDRSELILDIFAQRARSHEGKLQVELAQMKHLSTRLIKGWSHLERQKGGIGLRGPGETQLETDRRLIGHRIKTLQKRLDKVSKQREVSRRSRKKSTARTVALVGYTNSGKSTLFNQLTNANVFAKDLLFATLDPTLRQINLDQNCQAILADTVGFIRQLPHELVAAFQSTLSETVEADLLLHVVDLSDPNHQQMTKAVNQVLLEINAEQVPQLIVYNKIDRVAGLAPQLEYNSEGKASAAWISAKEKTGLDQLKIAIKSHLETESVVKTFCIKPSDGRLRSLLFQQGQVLSETTDETGNYLVKVELSPRSYSRLQQDWSLTECSGDQL